MSESAPRCPFCANVLKLQPSFWERIGLKASKVHCPNCRRTCDARDAQTMGSAYWHWAEVFRKEFVELVEELPILTDNAMNRALGMPYKEDMRLVASQDELVRTCLRHHRGVLVEMARGREATLDAVHLCSDGGKPEVVAVLGAMPRESGGKEREHIIARTGANHYVLYTYPINAGAEPRVRRAVHTKEKAPRALTDIHVNAMKAEPHAVRRYS